MSMSKVVATERKFNGRTLFVSAAISLMLLTLYAGVSAAQQVEASTIPTSIVIALEDERDYSVLLSTLFGEVGRSVDSTAITYATDLVTFRNRVARQIEQNVVVVNLIEEYALNQGAVDQYDEVARLKKKVESQKAQILSYIESDVFLVPAIRQRYNLYQSFVQRVFGSVGLNPVVELAKLRGDVFETHGELAALYSALRK